MTGGRPTTRYLDIAAELRSEIESGSIAPGQLLPSTRAITRRWGVAMATATKALTRLRTEGYAHPVPGVGTLAVTPGNSGRDDRTFFPEQGGRTVGTSATVVPVARRSTPLRALPSPLPVTGPHHARSPLHRNDIITAAIALADAEGAEKLSMRRIAARLGVSTMALYRHVHDKDELLDLMLERALTDLDPLCATTTPVRTVRTVSAVPDWRTQTLLAVRTIWRTLERHRWAVTAITRDTDLPPDAAEHLRSILRGAGLPPARAWVAHRSLIALIRGSALELRGGDPVAARSVLELSLTCFLDGLERAVGPAARPGLARPDAVATSAWPGR